MVWENKIRLIKLKGASSMAHWSEDCKRLEIRSARIAGTSHLDYLDCASLPAVYLFWLPAGRTDEDAANCAEAFKSLVNFCSRLDDNSTVGILTTPPDAARLLPYLQQVLKFQLWVAVKLSPDAYETPQGTLPQRHAVLLILSRYRESLRHTKTRVQYTYCPACGRTTKDYGGKKHVYHEYGTLISDIWRDIECDPRRDIDAVAGRVADLFGLKPYRTLHLLDLRFCPELAHRTNFSPEKTKTKARLQLSEIQLESGLINGDCLEVLRTLPDNSVDFCFADPPYNLKKKYDHCSDSQEIVDYFNWCDLWLAELARVLKPGRALAVVNVPLWSVRYYRFLSSILDFQCWIAWDALSFPVRRVMPAHYSILCFSKGEPRCLQGLSTSDIQDNEDDLSPLAENFCLRASCVSQRQRKKIHDKEEISDLWHDIHRLKHNSRRVDHPCQLPPKIMRRLFALFTRQGEMVLDCFNGAGTSTLVASQMGRRFLGIEVSPEYHDIALKRHEMLAQGDDPFGKCASVPKVKNSPVERLPKQKYKVTKKALQLEIKQIAGQLGHLPTREEVMAFSRYPVEYFDRYFLSWSEACAAARTTGMSERPPEQKNRTKSVTIIREQP